MMERLGQQLGNYRLTRLLGQGGFAEVYLGEHPVLGTTVAIKVLHTQVTEEDVALFQQEARLLASLRHVHIVHVLDFGVDKRTPYLVMDYTPNGTLRTRHARGTRLPVSTVVDYVKQVAEALQYAHDRKVVHRDVKPENMLIGEHGGILLSDFGIALIAQSSHYQSVKDLAGTIAYMAPEQIQALPRPASDQYALGVVAYEWLCGMCPFQGSLPEIAVKHSVTLPPRLRDYVPTLLPDIERVVLTALAKQPEERFASVRAFASALEQASQDVLPTQPLSPSDVTAPGSAIGSVSGAMTAPLGSDASERTGASPVPTESGGGRGWMGGAPGPTASGGSTVSSGSPVTQVPSAGQSLSEPMRTAGRRVVSRRAVLVGVVGAVAIAAAGSGVYVLWLRRPAERVEEPRDTAVPSPTPTVTPRYKSFVYTGHTDSVRGVAWSPDGERIVSGSFDGTVRVLNARDGREVFVYGGHTDSVWSVAWSPDGRWIASGGRDNTVQVWGASDGKRVVTYRGHGGDDVNTVAWSPDGKWIASGSDDKTVQVWNASDGSYMFTHSGHTDLIWSVAWSPDGRWIASGSRDNTVQVWNANGGKRVFTYRGHTGTVKGVAWSPDGKRIASASDDKTVQVWNANDGSGGVFTYKGHTNTVWSVAWSPDGRRVASGSLDKTVQVWDVGDGGRVFTYKEHTDLVGAVAWSPDGGWVVSGSSDRTVRLWSVGA